MNRHRLAGIGAITVTSILWGTTGTVAALALNVGPLASGLLELLLERRRLSRWWAVAAVLGIIGSTLLCLSTMTDAAESAGQIVAGIALGLIAGQPMPPIPGQHTTL